MKEVKTRSGTIIKIQPGDRLRIPVMTREEVRTLRCTESLAITESMFDLMGQTLEIKEVEVHGVPDWMRTKDGWIWDSEWFWPECFQSKDQCYADRPKSWA